MSQYILVRIQAIQEELETLKKLINNQEKKSRNKTRIRGLWNDIIVSDQDLEEAKKGVFKNALEWDQ
ncbi:MAG: hypothetical protein QNJ37_21755 [Crocosphaera sp.]|nr:hypothetical protein [Crocosphaera sp.]